MFDYTIKEISKIIGAEINIPDQSDKRICSISIDSRTSKADEVFFALLGESSDGHDYVKQAIARGASCAVVAFVPQGCENIPCLIVPDTFKALQMLVKDYRNRFNIPFVAVTGSSGKTTTKDLIASVLSKKYNVLKTPGNLNSTTGVPLTLTLLKESHEIAVIEMSMSHPGEILGNAEIVRPNAAVITNVGVAHIEFLKSRENIFKAKSEILTYLGKDDCAIVNCDDDMLCTLNPDAYSLIKVGTEFGDYKAENIQYDPEGLSFEVLIKDRKEKFSFPIPAKHNVINCLLAIAVGIRYDLSCDQIRLGLTDFSLSENRMEIVEENDVKLINDSYNANPDSMAAACDVLVNLIAKRRIAVLCDMYELGKDAEKMHYESGKNAAQKGIDVMLTCGQYKEMLKNGFDSAKLFSQKSESFEDKEGLFLWLKDNLVPGDCVLFKASRGMRLEEVFLRIKGELE